MSTLNQKKKKSNQIMTGAKYFVLIFKALSDQICFRIFNLLIIHDCLSLQEIFLILKTSELSIIRRLNKLEEYRLIKKSGNGRQTSYSLNKSNKNVSSLVNVFNN